MVALLGATVQWLKLCCQCDCRTRSEQKRKSNVLSPAISLDSLFRRHSMHKWEGGHLEPNNNKLHGINWWWVIVVYLLTLNLHFAWGLCWCLNHRSTQSFPLIERKFQSSYIFLVLLLWSKESTFAQSVAIDVNVKDRLRHWDLLLRSFLNSYPVNSFLKVVYNICTTVVVMSLQWAAYKRLSKLVLSISLRFTNI